jgi:hypothetical protein
MPPDPPAPVAFPVGAASEHAQVSNPKKRSAEIERARIIARSTQSQT